MAVRAKSQSKGIAQRVIRRGGCWFGAHRLVTRARWTLYSAKLATTEYNEQNYWVVTETGDW